MEYKEEETLKFEKTASGKYTYTIKLLGKPEENVKRIFELKKEIEGKL